MNAKALLAVSLLANAVLGYVAFKPRPVEPPPVAPAAAREKPSATAVAKPAVQVVESTVTNTLVRRMNWESVESPDYKEYIANLRSVGCPEETIRDIIIADVNKLYDAKKKQVRGVAKKFEYWKGGNPMAAMMGDSETMQKIKALDDEKNQVLRALGIEPDFKTAAAEMVNPLEQMFDFLPEGKKTQLVKLLSDMQTKMAKAMEGGGQPDPEQIAKAQKEMEAAVKQMLTPEEAMDFDLRMSMTANIMRMQIAGWDPDEKEFLDVFKLRKAFDDEFSPMTRGNESDAERQRREGAEKQLKEQLRQAMGEQRYKDYELSQDWQFQQTLRNLKRAELGVTEAKQVVEMKKLAEDQASKLRNDPNLSSDDRTTALTAIQRETEGALKKVLGDKGWEAINRGNGAMWLNNLAPRSAPPAGTAR
jgi:hypothetical protein